MRPRIDLSLPVGYGLSPRQFVELCTVAERAGLDGVTCGELAATEAMSLLGAIAASTSRLHLETSIGAVVTRGPALYVMAAATLHDLSGGRFALGLGAGSPVVAGFHGAEFHRPLDHVRRSVDAIRRGLAGGTLEEWGGFRLRGLEPCHVPILVSAMNEAMVELAGRQADGMILNLAAEPETARLGLLARKARADAGVDEPFEVHSILWLYAGEDVEHARGRFRLEMAPYLAVPTYRRSAVAIAGDHAVLRAEQAFRSGGRSAAAAVFPDELIDALLVVGDADDVAARVVAFGEAGAAGVRFTPIADDPAAFDDNCRVVELLGDVVRALGGPRDQI
jgi:alkanesulfonate monooxygenase SsuD/methylene tetrahydromethanopterin reductase-like flavin-dependent oxidoreductase (luciferase family)